MCSSEIIQIRSNYHCWLIQIQGDGGGENEVEAEHEVLRLKQGLGQGAYYALWCRIKPHCFQNNNGGDME